MSTPPIVRPPEKGEQITARFLRSIHSGVVGNIISQGPPGSRGIGGTASLQPTLHTRLFVAQDDFATTNDYYSGLCREVWYDPSVDAYALIVGEQITVFSLAAIANEDKFYAAWNPQSGRWEAVAVTPPESCTNTWYLAGHGAITGGYAVIGFTYNGVTEPIQIDWNDSAAAVQLALRAHSAIVAAGVTGEITCTLGALPGREIHITLTGSLAALTAPFSEPDSTLLVGDAGCRLQLGSFRAVSA